MASSLDRQASRTCSNLAVVGSGMGEDIGTTAGAREPARPARTLNRLVSATAIRDLSENPAEAAHSLHAAGWELQVREMLASRPAGGLSAVGRLFPLL